MFPKIKHLEKPIFKFSLNIICSFFNLMFIIFKNRHFSRQCCGSELKLLGSGSQDFTNHWTDLDPAI